LMERSAHERRSACSSQRGEPRRKRDLRQAIVLAGIGIDRAPIGRVRTLVGEVGIGREWLTFRRERAAPLEAHPLGTIALGKHRLFRQADRNAVFGHTERGREVSDDERYFHSALTWSPRRYHNSCVEDACARSVLAILHNFRDTARIDGFE
jgi:hypothetical protein